LSDCRNYDRLQVERLTARRLEAGVRGTSAHEFWPFLAVSVLAGEVRVEHRGRTVNLAAGELCILRNDVDVRIVGAAQSDVLIIRIPAGSVGASAHLLRAADGSVWPTHEGTASLVAHLLRGLAAQFDWYVPGNPARFAEHLVGLLILMCADAQIVRSAAESSADRLLARAKEYIEAHLAEPELTPDRIAAEHNISTRTLLRLFEAEGQTTSGWIRARRLEHCRLELIDGQRSGRSVSSIGARWGLWDAAHFSRLFKGEYGVSPKRYRLDYAGMGAENDSSVDLASAG
jgi:AraC-like DNA-binding protein